MHPTNEPAILATIRRQMLEQRQLAERYDGLEFSLPAAEGPVPPGSAAQHADDAVLAQRQELRRQFEEIRREFLLQLRAADDFYADRGSVLSPEWEALVEELRQRGYLSSIGALAVSVRSEQAATRRRGGE